MLLQDQRRFKEAESYFDQAIEQYQKRSQNHCICGVYLNKGLNYFFQQDFALAKEQYYKALRLSKNYGQTQNQNAIYINLASILYQERKYDEAIKLLDEALEFHLKFWSDNDMEAAKIYMNQASNYMENKQLEEAEKLFNQAYQIFKTIFDDDNTLEMAQYYQNVSNLYQAQEKQQESIDFSYKALEIYKSLYRETTSIGDLLCNLSTSESKLGLIEKSIEHAKESYEIYKKILGNQNNKVLHSLECIAYCYKQANDFENAIDYYKQRLTLSQELYGEYNAVAQQTLSELAYLYEDNNQHNEAIIYHKSSLNQISQIKGSEYEYLNILKMVGNANITIQNFESAIDYFQQAAELIKKIQPNDYYDRASILRIISALFKATKDFEKGTDYGKQALAEVLKEYPKDHESCASFYQTLAFNQLMVGEYEDCAINLEQYAKITENYHGIEAAKQAYIQLDDLKQMIKENNEQNYQEEDQNQQQEEAQQN